MAVQGAGIVFFLHGFVGGNGLGAIDIFLRDVPPHGAVVEAQFKRASALSRLVSMEVATSRRLNVAVLPVTVAVCCSP